MLATVVAFLLGFIGLLVFLGWLQVRVVDPGAAWWELLHFSINSMLISFLGAMALAAAVSWLANEWYYRRGAFTCPYCKRPSRKPFARCDCKAAHTPRQPETGSAPSLRQKPR